ncbi:hypothetical protein ACRALDRAFT_207242 [Sodiomyces alcalophilus JCM 7366]|uniref:uncharacterized protein n=1 Tax=Sodiomyces alcalophilus JCM 7366 TaxID=591952 RepID=UPI0039B454CA
MRVLMWQAYYGVDAGSSKQECLASRTHQRMYFVVCNYSTYFEVHGCTTLYVRGARVRAMQPCLPCVQTIQVSHTLNSVHKGDARAYVVIQNGKHPCIVIRHFPSFSLSRLSLMMQAAMARSRLSKGIRVIYNVCKIYGTFSPGGYLSKTVRCTQQPLPATQERQTWLSCGAPDPSRYHYPSLPRTRDERTDEYQPTKWMSKDYSVNNSLFVCLLRRPNYPLELPFLYSLWTRLRDSCVSAGGDQSSDPSHEEQPGTNMQYTFWFGIWVSRPVPLPSIRVPGIASRLVIDSQDEPCFFQNPPLIFGRVSLKLDIGKREDMHRGRRLRTYNVYPMPSAESKSPRILHYTDTIAIKNPLISGDKRSALRGPPTYIAPSPFLYRGLGYENTTGYPTISILQRPPLTYGLSFGSVPEVKSRLGERRRSTNSVQTTVVVAMSCTSSWQICLGKGMGLPTLSMLVILDIAYLDVPRFDCRFGLETQRSPPLMQRVARSSNVAALALALDVALANQRPCIDHELHMAELYQVSRCRGTQSSLVAWWLLGSSDGRTTAVVGSLERIVPTPAIRRSNSERGSEGTGPRTGPRPTYRLVCSVRKYTHTTYLFAFASASSFGHRDVCTKPTIQYEVRPRLKLQSDMINTGEADNVLRGEILRRRAFRLTSDLPSPANPVATTTAYRPRRVRGSSDLISKAMNGPPCRNNNTRKKKKKKKHTHFPFPVYADFRKEFLCTGPWSKPPGVNGSKAVNCSTEDRYCPATGDAIWNRRVIEMDEFFSIVLPSGVTRPSLEGEDAAEQYSLKTYPILRPTTRESLVRRFDKPKKKINNNHPT